VGETDLFGVTNAPGRLAKPDTFEVNNKSGRLVMSGVFGVRNAARVGFDQGLWRHEKDPAVGPNY